jgi:hypothetical protein
MVGTLDVGGRRVRFGSGGAGWSLPYGDWPLTRDVGRWGARHGAIAINHDATVWDPRLHRYREGVEIHADPNGRLVTEGCLAVERDDWAFVRGAVLAMMDGGRAFLHVDADGARISPVADKVVVVRIVDPASVVATDDEPRARRARRRYVHARYWRRARRYAGA